MSDLKTNTPPSPGSTAVIIGRWQLFHKGHETLLNAALASAENVIVVVGSALRSRDSRNPFNWQERKAMVQSVLRPADLDRVSFLPVRDYFDDEAWNEAVRKGVQERMASRAAPVLVGYKKDHTSYYLDHFPDWGSVAVPQELDVDATSLRNVFFEAADPDARMAVLAPYISVPVLNYLQAWSRLSVFAERVREHQAVVKYRKRWTANAYLTADAVVVASGHVLLVRRGGDIGYGQWACPGGFVEPLERFYDASVRELREETGFATLSSTMKAALRRSRVFDHPGRSPRGRLVTTAYHFDLGNIRLPEVKGADDAMEAKWVPIAELPSYVELLFEDHAAILDAFLGVYA